MKEVVNQFLTGVYNEAALDANEDLKDYLANEKDESAFKCD